MESIILLVVLLLLILLGAPIGFILILIPFVYILFTDAVPLVLIPSQMFNAIDSVPLTAIAFFMLTGELMTSATITDRLVALSRALIGRIRGGLAQVNVLVSMFFAGMNGSVVADTATVGALVLPAMKKAGYPAAFSAAVTGVSSTIGGIIPPSIMMIVLANSTEISRISNTTCWRGLLYCRNNSASSFRKSGYSTNSLSSWVIFTFVFYSRCSRVNYVPSKPIE
jgi:TRAP-type mannitol/chloroaromatic compound transport system permease large subunit